MRKAHSLRVIAAFFCALFAFCLTLQADPTIPQAIIFTLPAEAADSDVVDLTATGGASGNPVTFSVLSGPGAITNLTELRFTGLGPVVVAANQLGDTEYLAAPQVQATITSRENNPPFLIDDEVTVSNSNATISPLGNDIDFDGDLLTLVSVSDPSLTIRGRDVIIPAGFSGTFTYDATDGFATATGNVTVNTVAPITGANRYFGLLYDATTHAAAGWVRMLINPKGNITVQICDGARRGSGNFKITENGAAAATPRGTLTLVPNPDGTFNATLNGSEGIRTGFLRPGPASAPLARYHIALSSVGNLSTPVGGGRPVVTESIPGGGYAIARVRPDATVVVSGRLPDGTPFTAGSALSDINSIAFYVVTTIAVTPRGYVGGELLKADLERTDITGELVYFKPPQPASKYMHRGGFNTILKANGCLYNTINEDGPAVVLLSGGNLSDYEELFVNVSGGKSTPDGSLVDWFPRTNVGTFTAKIRVPFSRRAVLGSGIYLPKTQRAWGFFNGQNVGGRIDLSVDGGEFPPE